MSATVTLPLWLVVLALLLAAIAALDRILAPSVRWFFRRRMERVVARLNKRLVRPIEPFKLMQRQDMIVRLSYDPQVMQAVVEHAHETGVPESVAFQQARAYAREIVPSFSATVYFGVAIKLARWLSRLLYRVRLGHFDEAVMSAIDPKATVVFVMNHRSNMDYVLVTYLASDRSALSYAVGEWARIWPISRLIRAMGAYFIRRKSRNPLYRRVLARYVQMATAEGVTQAIFPEGGLSLDGRVGPAKLGLLNYIVTGFEPGLGRDVIFIPVALNYDRVMEDRVLIGAHQTGERRFRARIGSILMFFGKHLWQKLRGRFQKFGYAAVSFGSPMSLASLMKDDPALQTEALGALLMARITALVPVLPVPLVSAVLLMAPGPLSHEALTERAIALLNRLRAAGAYLHLPQGQDRIAVAFGLQILTLRRLIDVEGGLVAAKPEEAAVLAFYAASILQLLPEENGGLPDIVPVQNSDET